MNIGIFDSGMGGISVLYEAKKYLPNENFIYYGDSKHAPYGIKTKEEVIDFSVRICDYLIERNVDAIVVACNTATSAAVKFLRKKYAIPIIGMEPALKPAVEINQGLSIAVMATVMTLKETKFKMLMNRIASKHNVYKIAASEIVESVEKNQLEDDVILPILEDYFKGMNDIESVVLGCTHFIFIREQLKKILGKDVHIIDGNYGTVMELKRKLSEIETSSEGSGSIEIINSAGDTSVELSYALLKKLEVTDGNQ